MQLEEMVLAPKQLLFEVIIRKPTGGGMAAAS